MQGRQTQTLTLTLTLTLALTLTRLGLTLILTLTQLGQPARFPSELGRRTIRAASRPYPYLYP